MFAQAASVADATTPPPPGVDSVAFESSGELQHIPDETGEDRRLFEGWMSLAGIDWQDEDVRPEVFESAIAQYMAKNPVILWDHKRDWPIGVVLHMEVVPDVGVHFQGRLFDARDFDGIDEDQSELLKKCNELWPLILGGKIRGISWSGRSRKRWAWSGELQKYVKQPVQILIHETTVTAIQVHPGARITGVNTLAKALEICKALPTEPVHPSEEGDIAMSLEKIQEAKAAYLAALQELPDGVELPPEIIEGHGAISKALGIEPPPQPGPKEDPPEEEEPESSEEPESISKALKAAMVPFLQKLDDQQKRLDELAHQPGPLRNRVGHQEPAGAAPPPRENELDGSEVIAKALEIGGDSMFGVSEKGEGSIKHGCMGDDLGLSLMKLWMAKNRHRVAFGPFTLSPAGRNLLNQAQAQLS